MTHRTLRWGVLALVVPLLLVSCKGYPYVEIREGVTQAHIRETLGRPDFQAELENQQHRWIYYRRPMRDTGRLLRPKDGPRILKISPSEYNPTRGKATAFADINHAGGDYAFTLYVTFNPDNTLADFEYHIHTGHGLLPRPISGSGPGTN